MSNDPNLLRGQKPGDRRVRVTRPESKYFRYSAPGVVVARPTAIEPRTPLGRAAFAARRRVFGRPIESEAEITERLPKWKALPVFSSDVMSSVAYATEASLFTLLGAGTQAFVWLIPISLAIVCVLALVTLSYRQTIRAYPNGGGSYIVAHANLGVMPGLIAAAALLTDYVLTVAVSVSSGVQALYSLFPPLLPLAVPIIVALILMVMAVNLRGIRESGTIFAAPTYIFLVSALVMIGCRRRADPARHAAPGHRRDAGAGPSRDLRAAPAHARVRRRLLGDDRDRGRGQRRARLQAPGVGERPSRPC